MRNKIDICFAIIMFVVETIKCCLDWKLTNNVMNTSEPLNEIIKQCCWWLSLWGTLVYLLTLLSLCCDLKRDEDNENPCSPVLSLVSSITKDIPQVVFAVVVAIFTRKVSFGVQFLKFLLEFISHIIRFVQIRYDFKQREETSRTASANYECLTVFEFIFFIIMFFFSCVQFLCFWFILLFNDFHQNIKNSILV